MNFRTSAYPRAIYAWRDPADPEFIFRSEVFERNVSAETRWSEAEFRERFVPLDDWRWHNTGCISGWSTPRRADGTFPAPTQILEWRPTYEPRTEDRIFPEDSDALR